VVSVFIHVDTHSEDATKTTPALRAWLACRR